MTYKSFRGYGAECLGLAPRMFFLDNDGHMADFGSRTLSSGAAGALEIINEMSEHGFAVVTGRSRQYAERAHQKTNPRAIASEQGMLIHFADGGRIVYPDNLDEVKRFQEYIEERKEGEWLTYSGEDGKERRAAFVEEPGKEVIYTMSLDPLRVDSLSDAPPGTVRKMARDLGTYLGGLIISKGYGGRIFPVVNQDSVEIVPCREAKGWAMEEICRELRTYPEMCYAGGDSASDIPMIRRAGMCGTVSNASGEVKTSVRERGGLVSDQPHGYGFRDNVLKMFGYDE